ncbi:SusD/RagB family nutrient-binding outer membrane lipoprotein [Fibrella aquatilis]|uniref:SusD/RagB family nutrient-binding outer membrane lipoprotein n=1 Tax=Fibrella aquatilis TaxID=2817059 RepID=A0A939JZD8_9BACT|nr:SusD/RagB family nutrient-binding outer membrane lipoprotein [Fibrella aquatilis]MBO0933039.1 SusD/RagB family nutrient-binding outer membrane lipoprotein [Fibrella aquatilis]
MKKILVLSLALSLVLSSCEKNFDTINANPNDPTSVPPELLLPHGIKLAVNSVQGGSLGLDVGPLWAQHLARIQYTEVDQYNFTTDVQDTPWRDLYIEANADFQKIIDLGKSTSNENYQAIGLIMRSYVFSQLTDVYGDIPYKEALLGTKGNVLPKYDTQKTVYAGLVADLKTASDLINTKAVDKTADILLAGNMTGWKKFANSLSLRLLNRMVGKSDSPIDTKAEMTRILSDPTKYPVLTSNADNIQLTYLADAPNNNPTNQNRKTRDDHRVSKTLIDKLTALKDPRLAVYAALPAGGGTYAGVPNGLPNADASALGLTKTSKIGDYFVRGATPGVLVSYAELNFIKAEAALNGITAAGDAAKAYEEGIRASMTQYSLTLPADYLTLNKLSTGTAALTQVIEQKWLALFGQSVEAWTEVRRTGIPALKIPPTNYNDGVLPQRLPYPSNEENLNTDNFKAALTSMGGSNTMKTKLWWRK